MDLQNNGITEGTEPPIQTCVGPIHCWECIPENLPNHPTLAFFGKRRTGKSTTITNILFHCCQDIPFGIVMSDTAYAGYWEKIVPKQYIVQGLQQDVLNWLIDRQSKLVEKYGVEDPRIAAFIVLDDVVADQKTIRWSADLARFFVQGRHLAITGKFFFLKRPVARGRVLAVHHLPVHVVQRCVLRRRVAGKMTH